MQVNIKLNGIMRARQDEAARLSEPLNAAIKKAEGRARARCIDPASIVKSLESVEKNLNIPKKYLRGVKVTVCPYAQNFPHAYLIYAHTPPKATWFRAEYRSSGWVVTEIYRGECARANREYSIELTDAAKTAVIDRISRNR